MQMTLENYFANGGTNREYLSLGWSSNVATIQTIGAGDGTSEPLQFIAVGSIVYMDATNFMPSTAIALGRADGLHRWSTIFGNAGDLDQASTSGAVPVLKLDQADVSEEFIRFIGTSTTDASQSLVDAADMEDPGAIFGWLKIYVQDDQATNPITDGAYFVPFYAAPTHSA
jgi:hypothetical protein